MASTAVQAVSKTAVKTFRELHGVVVTAGLMDKTVKVRVGGQKWNKFLKKHFDDPKTHLVHDPANSLREGDVVAISPGWRESRSKRHVVKHIIAPGKGIPISDRPPIPPIEELIAEKDSKRAAKVERRELKAENKRVEAALGAAQRVTTTMQKELENMARILASKPANDASSA
ncbi:hypothetical protein QBC35DRAFT_504010 [Podospora australis]|uniref:Uncharacterized protein n=1 Tax=Podospora australis TaxID=1536484 RepID=A0AAN6WNW6_9PEZI|nr:hypothetical protein QBC35DRAFT_504010 [Podospora australis]